MSVIALVALLGAVGAEATENGPDSAYRWQVQQSSPNAIVADLVSQRWRESAWRHSLRIVRPAALRHPDLAVLIVGGDGSREFVDEQALAEAAGVAVARIGNVPNQPLYGQREDALISYTFEQFLRTADPEWPLLVPMTRAALRGMDAVAEIAAKEWQLSIRRFVVTGASKRGWTSWLAGASDPRVAGIVPVVFDNLSFAAQLKHQHDVWNAYSPELGDYTERSLQAFTETEHGRQLLKRVDPYEHLEPLARVAKLVVNGANDPYWELGAVNLYWNELRGPKSLLEIPNAGHGAGGDRRVGPTMAAFVDRLAAAKPMPELRWSGSERETAVTSDEAPSRASFWVAESASRDFRGATWRQSPAQQKDRRWVADVAFPAGRFVAYFAEAEYAAPTGPLTLSTPVRIVSPSAPSP